jgi:hypothetical protein
MQHDDDITTDTHDAMRNALEDLSVADTITASAAFRRWIEGDSDLVELREGGVVFSLRGQCPENYVAEWWDALAAWHAVVAGKDDATTDAARERWFEAVIEKSEWCHPPRPYEMNI